MIIRGPPPFTLTYGEALFLAVELIQAQTPIGQEQLPQGRSSVCLQIKLGISEQQIHSLQTLAISVLGQLRPIGMIRRKLQQWR